MTDLSRIGPNAEFIGAGDSVVVIQHGSIVARGVLVDGNADRCIVSVGREWREYTDAWSVAHPDSPAAEAAT